MTTTGVPTPRIGDRLRREAYLTRLSWHMQDYPGREYRRVRQELRAEITAAAGEVGMAAALRDLGRPAALAQAYLGELDGDRPRYTTGAVAAALVVAAFGYLGAAYALGTVDTLEAFGGGRVTRYPFGARTVFSVADGAVAVETQVTWVGVAVVLGAAAIAFALASRLWRAGRRGGAPGRP